ncbi:MAG TPA: hypothetical protein VGN01_00525 [Acidobacteriaceae bacterium]
MNGLVRGGQQPIVGAHVYLFAAGTAGYGGAGTAASAANASVSLLTSGMGTTLDGDGGATNGDYYATTDGNGSFSITGSYICTTGAQVYLYALGGDPGSGLNTAAGLMAVLGSCPAAGSFPSSLYVVVNEVSTVAAAYALAGFATDATHVGSSGTALASTGIANAFANAANLETLSTGAALVTTPAGNGTVPQTEINTLANVLAACVNSTGPGSSACSTVLANALPAGTTGAQPADTATAAINIAHNPGANVATLYALASGTPPFAPGLTSAPNDFTVELAFTSGGLSTPVGIAIDARGNVWVSNYNDGVVGSVTELASSGLALSGAGGYTGGGLAMVHQIAIDMAGNAWIANGVHGGIGQIFPLTSVVKLSSAGVAYGGNPYIPISNNGPVEPNGIAIDGTGNAWITSFQYTGGTGSVTAISSAENSYSGPYLTTGVFLPGTVAIDGNGNVWVGGPAIAEFTSAGVIVSGSMGYKAQGGGNYNSIAIDANGNAWATGATAVVAVAQNGSILSGSGYTGGGINGAHAIAIDGANNVWVADSGSLVSELSSTGAAVSPTTGYGGQNWGSPGGIAIDGSGNVWFPISLAPGGSMGTTVVEMVGAGTPVVTPLAAGVKNNTLGTRP